MGPVFLLCVAFVVAMSEASLCGRGGRQFWDLRRELCTPCRECPPGQVVLRPCQPHSDTSCGPLSALNIDWSWLPRNTSHHHQQRARNRTKHLHHHHHHNHHHHHDKRPPESAAQVKADDAHVAPSTSLPSPTAAARDVRVHTEPPFSATETLVWDWQVVVLGLAVCACVLFFVVTGIYSIHHARQWRRFKSTFEADVEELSAQLSLMSPSSLVDSTSAECAYLEQLLVQKQHDEPSDARGNVYIAVNGNSGGSPRM